MKRPTPHARSHQAILPLSGLLLLCLLAAGPAPKPLVLELKTGDSVVSILWRHAAEVRSHVPSTGTFAGLDADELVRKLLTDNRGGIPHGVHAGNEVLLFVDGRVSVVRGKGEEPTRFASAEQRATLARDAPDMVHDQLVELAEKNALPLRDFTVSEDRQRVTVEGTTYVAGRDVHFEKRTGHFHVVGRHQRAIFSLPVWPFSDVPFAFPKNPFFSLSGSNRVEAKKRRDAALARMIVDGQLLVHDDHYHLTRRFDDRPWQKLLAMSKQGGAATELVRKMAVAGVVILLQEHLHLDSDMVARDLLGTRKRIARFTRAIESGSSGHQAAFALQYSAELQAEGKLVFVRHQQLAAGDGLSFGFCKTRLHVVGEPGIDISVEPPPEGKRLVFPANLFVGQDRNDRVTLRPLATEIRQLLEKKEVVARDHGYRPTEALEPAAVEAIRAGMVAAETTQKMRQDLETRLEAILDTEIPVTSKTAMLRAVNKVRRELTGLVRRIPTPIGK